MLFAFLLLTAPPRSDKTRVMVMDIKGAEDLTPLIPSTLIQLNRFDAVSMAELKQMVSFEETRQLIGCSSNASCLAEIGGALGAAYVITSTLTKEGNKHVLQMQLVNNQRVRVEARLTREATGDMRALIVSATKQLVRPILELKPGKLHLQIDQEGATAKLDGEVLGVTPIAITTVAGGAHNLMIEKPGFLAIVADIDIKPGDTLVLKETMRPSLEALRAKQQRATALRASAWTLTVAGGVGIIAGATLWALAAGQAGALANDIRAYNAQPLKIETSADALRRRDANLATLDLGAITALSLGIAAAAAGVSLFIIGESPSKYDTQLRVTPNGVAGAF